MHKVLYIVIMLPNRYLPGQSSVLRKSRLEGKPSLLPKPRRQGSTDRLSTEARRPSTTGLRSSSAEPARGTFGVGRLSREASATKLPLNGRSRSQTGEARYGQPATTPLRSNHYSRPTATPVRTPSEDRAHRSWQTSLERALAFVTIKDQRPISTAAWQRAASARAAEALGARGAGPAALVRPLTIARFVDLVGALVAALTRDVKLNTDNYVTKLPHLSKRLLYPGAVSKSWLRTVNTLHAFPHALALLAYLLDLVRHVEMPVLDEWLYVGKDDLACLRRDYLYKCWIRFQDPGHEFQDLNEDYLENLKQLLGNDEEKIAKLQQVIKKYETCLEDEEELAAKAEEARRVERREAYMSALRAERSGRRNTRAQTEASNASKHDNTEALRSIDTEIERLTSAVQAAGAALARQPLSVAERTRLLDDVDYSLRVLDSKRALAQHISKMVVSKETELALWQKRTLDSSVEYAHGLIHLAPRHPQLASLAIDEKELMGAECGARVAAGVAALRALSGALQARRTDLLRERGALERKRAQLADEARSKISEIKSAVEREQLALDSELAKECSEASAWSSEEAELRDKIQALRANREEYARTETEMEFWEKQDLAWRSKLATMREYVERQRAEARRALRAAREKRVALVAESLRVWNNALG